MADDLYHCLEQALLEADVDSKCVAVKQLNRAWRTDSLSRKAGSIPLSMDEPGRPDRPLLVDPRRLRRRSTATGPGRILLLHAIAHIEFCAINIALDAVYRFRDMPDRYVTDWLRIAEEEAKHFELLDHCLRQRGSYYGEFEAHNGLWDMVCKTRHDIVHRMALVPRVMEARGLDVTPGMIQRFEQVGDQQAADILKIIYEEEIGHVNTGSYWFRASCMRRGLDANTTFGRLVDDYFKDKLRGPFNWPARLKAGFQEEELKALER